MAAQTRWSFFYYYFFPCCFVLHANSPPYFTPCSWSVRCPDKRIVEWWVARTRLPEQQKKKSWAGCKLEAAAVRLWPVVTSAAGGVHVKQWIEGSGSGWVIESTPKKKPQLSLHLRLCAWRALSPRYLPHKRCGVCLRQRLQLNHWITKVWISIRYTFFSCYLATGMLF